jgi:membrane-associated protease RseP (regulator of RpoE activity)
MRNALLIAIVLVPLLAVAAAPEQRSPEVYGFSSEDAGTGSYLGIDMADITPERMSALKLNKEQGVEVTMVDQDAPAGKAGIREHDVILTMNGTAIESGAQLRRMIHETPPGRVINLGLSRDGQPLSVQVKLAERANKFAFKMPPMPPIPPMPRVNIQDMDVPVSVVVIHSALHSGLMIENLTPQLGDYFGAKNGNGVLVRSVEKGSRAEKAGFRAGDVIVRVDKEPVHDASDFSSALRSHRRNGSVSIGLIRDKREQTITLTLPQPKESGVLLDEESLALPDVNIEANVDLEGLQNDLDKLPEIAFADIKPQIDAAMQQAQRSTEEARKELRKQQKELNKQLQKHQREFQKQMHDQSQKLQEQMKQEQKEIQRELRDLQMGSAEI